MELANKIIESLKSGALEKIPSQIHHLSIDEQDYEFEKALFTSNVLEDRKAELFRRVLKRNRPDPEVVKERIRRNRQAHNKKMAWMEKYNSHELTIEDLKSPPTSELLELKDNYISDLLRTKRLDTHKVKHYYNEGLLTEERAKAYLRSKSISEDDIRSILRITNKEVTFPDSWFSARVQLKSGINDLLVIGNATAGKTSFLASFMSYIQYNRPGFELKDTRSYGYRYGSRLINAAQNGECFGGTIKYKAINILGVINPRARYFPCNIVDLPGEAFITTYSKLRGMEMPANFESVFLSHHKNMPFQNPKVLLFTISVDQPKVEISEKFEDVDVHGNRITRTSSYKIEVDNFYQSFLTLLHEEGIMKNVVGIAIIATKWDKHSEFGFSNKEDFIEKVCPSMNNLIQSWQTTIYRKLKYATFTYSIGQVDEELKYYVHDPKGTDELYNWLIKKPRVLKELTQKGIQKVFGHG